MNFAKLLSLGSEEDTGGLTRFLRRLQFGQAFDLPGTPTMTALGDHVLMYIVLHAVISLD